MLFLTLLFYIFSAILVICALAVVSAKNTVHGVMFLILAFANAAGLFVLLQAEFLAMLLIIVYVGAIAVLFLFVVMMLNIDEIKTKIKNINHFFAFLIAAALIAELVIVIYISDKTAGSLPTISKLPIDPNITNTQALGNVLYTKFIFPFQLSGGVLFVAMIGAIVLTIRENKRFIRKQSISAQVNRKREDAVEVVKVESGKGLNI